MRDPDKLKLTDGSFKKLRGFHKGSGRVFRSEGDDNTTSDFFFKLFMGQDGCARLCLGNLKSVKLTPEQTAALDGFITYDFDSGL